MLVEGIRIFYPNLYEAIRANPESFVKGGREVTRDEEHKQRVKQLVERALEADGVENKEIVRRRLLEVLFPRLKGVLGNTRGDLSGKPETFNFLGFTHITARTRAGKFLLRRRTMKQRLWAKLKEVAEELRRRRHQPVPAQGRWLASVVRGHIAYFGVPTNRIALDSFRSQAGKSWYRALKRRS